MKTDRKLVLAALLAAGALPMLSCRGGGLPTVAAGSRPFAIAVDTMRNRI